MYVVCTVDKKLLDTLRFLISPNLFAIWNLRLLVAGLLILTDDLHL